MVFQQGWPNYKLAGRGRGLGSNALFIACLLKLVLCSTGQKTSVTDTFC